MQVTIQAADTINSLHAVSMKIIPVLLLVLYLALLVKPAAAQEAGTHYIPVADSKVFAAESGSGDALILLHAGNMDHRMWKEQVPVFSKKFRVITIDIRGCGNTQDGDSTYLQSAAIAAVMDSLRIAKASFAGVSLGAVAATDFALTYPARVNKLVLVSPGLIGLDLIHDSMMTRAYRQMDAAWKQGDTLQYINLFVNVWVDGPNRKPAGMNQAVRSGAFAIASENIRKRKAGVHLGLNYQPTQLQQLPSLKPPVLVITGSLDVSDILLIAAEYKKNGAKTIMIPGVAHMLNMEKPALFNKEVLNFLEE